MKKNHKNAILCSLLTLAVIQTQSQAALIAVNPGTGDANISATVNATNSGANTVTATGGTSPVVTLQTGALLTGDAAAGVNQFIGINITAAGYTITNDGSITASNDAIRSNNAAIINNNLGGVLSGTGAASQGIDMAGGATAAITNSGTISGLADAISITSATVLITNTTTGVIEGLTNATSDGISAQASATVNNSNIIRGQGNGILATSGLTVNNLLTTSTITGNVNGISATTGASITNFAGATITGTTAAGVSITDGTVTNTGTIRGAADGILASGAATTITNNLNGIIQGTGTGSQGIDMAGGTGSTITNNGTISGQLDAILVRGNTVTITNQASGLIDGTTAAASDGISALGAATVTNSGTIRGLGNGVLATTGLIVTNNAGSISGGANGISATTGMQVTNSAQITGVTNGILGTTGATITNNAGATISGTGVAGVGVQLGTGTITNTGSITGVVDGILLTTDLASSITNNVNGTITGTGATAQGIDMFGNGSSVTNHGTISGLNDGILVRSDTVTITNSATGVINGLTGTASDGISVAGISTINNSNVISGNGNGISAVTNATINNNTATSTITGRVDGIFVNGSSTITNTLGTITGTEDDGIDVGSGTVTNSGSITGADRGISMRDLVIANSITNTGSITGLVGIETNSGADTVTFDAGTLVSTAGITGSAALLGGGDDIFNITGGTVVTGIVDGGAGIDTLNITGASTMNGGVAAFETIARTGAGAATINGNTTADVITVNTTGSLYINGNVTPSTVAASAITLTNGELGGTGTWTAGITQTGGALSAGTGVSTVGTLTTTGNLDVTGGRLIVNANPAANTMDRINVGGNVNVAGATMDVVPNSQDAPLQSGTRLVVATSGTVTGNYTSATFFFENSASDAGLQATHGTGYFTSSTVSLAPVVIAGQGIALDVVHHYDTVANLSPFGVAFGENLNTQVSSALFDPTLADFLGFLDYSDADTVACVMNAYEAEYLVPIQAIALQSSREVHRIVEQHNAVGRITGEQSQFWGNFNGNFGGDADGYRYTLGVGRSFGALNVGVLVSQYDTDDLGLGTVDADLQALTYGLYFASGGSTGWQFNGFVGMSDNESDTSRATDPLCTQLDRVISASPEASGLQALLSGGYMMEKGSCTWGPTFGLEYANMDMDRTSISPGPGLPAMSYNTDEMESLRSLIGVRAEFHLDKTHPYVSAQWAHEFEGDISGYTATFQGSSFDIAQPLELASDSLILRAGLIHQFSDVWSGDIGYLGEIAIDGDVDDVHGLNLGLHASF